MNILFFMADEFRRDAAGFGSPAPLASTPHLDALAKDATVFTNAYTPSPVCVPARQCLATGRYPIHNGCENFHSDLAPGSETFARWFADRGYLTVACGKLHHRGPDQMQGWLHRIGSDTAVRWPEAFSDRSQIGRRPWRREEELRLAGAGVSPLQLHDELTTDGACHFLRMFFGGMYPIDPAIPLLLFVSFQQPHFPLLCPPDALARYLPEARLPENLSPPCHPDLARYRHGAPEADILRARAAYAGMVESVDARIGRVLSALAECGQNADDWLIVFTSDHGDLLGEHGCWEKRSFYESSAGIPLFLRGGPFGGGRSARPANLVDLFPTLCDAAGFERPTGIDGRSLLEDADETFSQLGTGHFMLRRGHWKYIVLGPDAGDEVLFDLASDPGETCNAAGEHPAECRALRARLTELTAGRVRPI